MTLGNLLEVMTFGDYLKIFFVIFFWPILLAILHLIMFRKMPFGNLKEDIKTLKTFWQEVSMERQKLQQEKTQSKKRVEHDYDYWEDVDYDTGEVGADSRPSIRHPKNRDRAYSGSA